MNEQFNFGLVHKRCNMLKGDMTYEEFRSLREHMILNVASYWPRLQKRLIAAGWRYRG